MVTPVGKDAVVADTLLTRLQVIAAALGMPVALPDIAFNPADHPDGYLVADHLPNAPAWEAMHGGGKVMDQGLSTLSAYLPKGQGVIRAANILGAIKAALPSGTALWADGVKIKITRDPWTAPPLLGDPFSQYPITIAWEAV